MKTWYGQIAWGLVASFVIGLINMAVSPDNTYLTRHEYLEYLDTNGFHVLVFLSGVAAVLVLVGLVRGFLAMLRKFRSFVRIDT